MRGESAEEACRGDAFPCLGCAMLVTLLDRMGGQSDYGAHE